MLFLTIDERSMNHTQQKSSSFLRVFGMIPSKPGDRLWNVTDGSQGFGESFSVVINLSDGLSVNPLHRAGEENGNGRSRHSSDTGLGRNTFAWLISV